MYLCLIQHKNSQSKHLLILRKICVFKFEVQILNIISTFCIKLFRLDDFETSKVKKRLRSKTTEKILTIVKFSIRNKIQFPCLSRTTYFSLSLLPYQKHYKILCCHYHNVTLFTHHSILQRHKHIILSHIFQTHNNIFTITLHEKFYSC